MTAQPIPAHLGGYCPGGDPATQFPELWTWLVHDLGVKTVIDVGSGEGQALDYFRKLGCDAIGIDGVSQPRHNFLVHDYTTGPLVWPTHFNWLDRIDLCWSAEFVEHVEEEYAPNFLNTFARADIVLMTHADPGQLGHHHVNCQPAAYWIERLGGYDFELDQKLTATTRALAAANDNPWNHYVRSGLAFRRLSA